MSRPILVTGIHRSGSTWLGEMISLADHVGYIHEPFNQGHGKCICGYDIRYWYQGVAMAEEPVFRRHFDHLFRFSGHTILSDLKNGKFKKIGVQFRRGQFDPQSRLAGHRPLVKDPLALLAADWLYKTYDAEVVITVRHPAAFVDSLRRKNWTFDFRHLTNQPELMQGKLARYSEDLYAAAALNEREQTPEGGAAAGALFPIEEQAMLLWKVLHAVIIEYQSTYPDWIILRHEDVSRDPFSHFEKLYSLLGLDFTRKISDKLEAFVNPPRETSGKRRSAENSKRWATKLEPELVNRIRQATGEVSDHFYSEEDW